MGSFSITDFGRLVKPKVLLCAFIMCKHESLDPDCWWRKARENNRASKTFKRDMISGTYGMDFRKLFADLPRSTYVAKIVSFLVLHRGTFKLITTPEEASNLRTGNRITICAIGVEMFVDHNRQTNQLGEKWAATAEEHISWFFVPRQIIPLELVDQYNSAEVGDLVMYTKSHGMVAKTTVINRRYWWGMCSWTDKKVMVLSGQRAKATKLSVDRPYRLIKASAVLGKE